MENICIDFKKGRWGESATWFSIILHYLHLHMDMNEPEHSHYLLNNKITVSDAEELESFLVSPICSVTYGTFSARLLEITRQMQNRPALQCCWLFSREGCRDCSVHTLRVFYTMRVFNTFLLYTLSILWNDFGRTELWGLHRILALPTDLGQIINLL